MKVLKVPEIEQKVRHSISPLFIYLLLIMKYNLVSVAYVRFILKWKTLLRLKLLYEMFKVSCSDRFAQFMLLSNSLMLQLLIFDRFI